MCESSMSLFSNQSVAKKHTWKGDVVSQEDRFSPSRDSLDSGFSSFPASPNSSSSNTADAPPQLVKFYNTDSKDDSPPKLVNCSLFNTATDVLTEDEDEPTCKMPRLVAIDEESDNELIEESTILSLSVPEKEEEEPKPETANIPTTEEPTKVKSSGRRVRIATPNEEVDENEDPYAKCYKPQHPCQWADCSEEFFDVNDLYDHAMEQHLQLLRPSDSLSTSSGRRELSTQDDKEDDESEQKYRCQWLDCGMSLRRGTEEKKFDWLMNHHFRARHAPKAQPLKCLIKGCPIRFQNVKTLNAHLLNSHDDRPVRKTQQPVVKQISCYDYALPVRTETYGVFDFFDKYTFDLIGKKVEQYYTESNEQIDNVNNIETIKVDEKPIQQIIPSMPRKKTVTVLRKLFARRLTHLKF